MDEYFDTYCQKAAECGAATAAFGSEEDCKALFDEAIATQGTTDCEYDAGNARECLNLMHDSSCVDGDTSLIDASSSDACATAYVCPEGTTTTTPSTTTY